MAFAREQFVRVSGFLRGDREIDRATETSCACSRSNQPAKARKAVKSIDERGDLGENALPNA